VTFEEYLITKKIDSRAFALAKPVQWGEWQREFAEVHPNSFTAQKLYLINNLRRLFPLPAHILPEPSAIATATNAAAPATVVAKPKPIMRPKIN
jgi:hypothetical protein